MRKILAMTSPYVRWSILARGDFHIVFMEIVSSFCLSNSFGLVKCLLVNFFKVSVYLNFSISYLRVFVPYLTAGQGERAHWVRGWEILWSFFSKKCGMISVFGFRDTQRINGFEFVITADKFLSFLNSYDQSYDASILRFS